MARPSKGDRTYHMVRFHPVVLQRLVEMAGTAGASSVSQYGADVLALYADLPEHVRELNQARIVPASRKVDTIHGDAYGRLMIRPHREVSERLASQAGGQVTAHIADILAVHVGLPEYARPDSRVEEVLPLAI
ncbi:hypothetical protein [Mycobacterium riyadhense]|uniref:hypothetical protein n=1 Tax=Mycobacterium riyadhense TaxID=486698 RepID=UPI00195B5782|nr:hypothetical protein [Mycobacterium riyadhense]